MRLTKTATEGTLFNRDETTGIITRAADPEDIRFQIEKENNSEEKTKEYNLADQNIPKMECIDLGDTLAYCAEPGAVLHKISEYCAKTGCEIVFSMPNALFADRVAGHLFSEEIPEACRSMTMAAIKKMIFENNLEIKGIETEKGEKQQLREMLERGQFLAEAVDHFTNLTETSNDVKAFHIRCGYSSAPKKEKPEDSRPFLSIVIRTIGKRLQELKEVFLCLNCQTNLDYEVLLMTHNAAPETVENVRKLLEFIPEELRDRYRLIQVEGGTRSRPINAAIDQAAGRYFAVLDDDDIVTADWVDAFHTGYIEQPNATIHTYAVSQAWSKEGNRLRSEGETDGYYCQPFDWNVQYNFNRCPLMTMAFPLDIVRRMKYRFDETLNTTEDWDFMMKVVAITDVKDVPACTAIYRRWINAENSATLYSQSEWRKTEQGIRKQFKKLWRVSRVSNLMADENQDDDEEEEEEEHNEAEIWFEGERFYADMFNANGNSITLRFNTPLAATKPTIIRIDPYIYGGFRIRNPRIYTVSPDDKIVEFTGRRIQTNGFKWKKEILFYFSDPQMSIKVPAGTIKAVEVSFKRTNEILGREGLKLLPLVHMNLVWKSIVYVFSKAARKFSRAFRR